MFKIKFYLLLYLKLALSLGEKNNNEQMSSHGSMYLTLYSPNEVEYTDVLVRVENQNLTLVCELRGPHGNVVQPRLYMWNYLYNNGTKGERPHYTIEPMLGPTVRSKLTKYNLQVSDSGRYWCSSPPFSITKYILVQSKSEVNKNVSCTRGAYHCGLRCVLPAYVCDGFRDCANGEDEDVALCGRAVCEREDRLNCSSGRCIPTAACCRPTDTLRCNQPSCCKEHFRFDNYAEEEFLTRYNSEHHPTDDYGFIQSTIYTVTACALIFMIAVVFLVSAICKMHMKRAALRSYSADPLHRTRYSIQYAQTHRFPPCYEASRLLEQDARPPSSDSSPVHRQQQSVHQNLAGDGAQSSEENRGSRFTLTTLSTMFTPIYRQVPTECLDRNVEMREVRSASLNNSPTRSQTRTRLENYRSPTYCDLNADLYFNSPEIRETGRDLNMAAPLDFFRRRQQQRPITLQLGRFQLSIPRFGRRPSEPRPDTPNVAEINIDDLDFVRLNSNDTYTLNGRTIRLLGANFENYPVVNTRPPPYNEAMRYKLYGPPPEYLSRDNLDHNRNTGNTEEQARSNVEMPPRYEELSSGGDPNANTTSHSSTSSDVNRNTNGNVTADNSITNNTNVNVNADVSDAANTSDAASSNSNTRGCNNNNNNVDNNAAYLRSVISDLPAIDSDLNSNEPHLTGH